jgi:transcriptional regulator with XRE-family HTH domain
MPAGRPPKSPRGEFGQRVFELRDGLKLSQKAIAKKLGMSQSGYARWERCAASLRPDQLLRIAAFHRIPVGELVGETPLGQNRSKLSPRGLRLLEDISRLSPERQEKIYRVIVTLLEE